MCPWSRPMVDLVACRYYIDGETKGIAVLPRPAASR